MKSGLLKTVLVVCILALASLACGMSIPGVTDAPANESAPTPIVPSGGNGGNEPANNTNDDSGNSNESGNSNGGDPIPPSDRPLLDDDFKGRDSNWGVGTDTDSAVEYVNDALQFIVYTTNFFVYSTPNDTEYQNVHIEVTAQNASTDKNAAFGIMCSQQFIDDSFYYAYVTPSGDYGIVKSVFVEDDVDLATGSSDLIPQNASSYRIGLDCGNGTITLYVNGQKIDTGADAEYTAGTVALFAWSDEVSGGTNVSFDDIVITTLP